MFTKGQGTASSSKSYIGFSWGLWNKSNLLCHVTLYHYYLYAYIILWLIPYRKRGNQNPPTPPFPQKVVLGLSHVGKWAAFLSYLWGSQPYIVFPAWSTRTPSLGLIVCLQPFVVSSRLFQGFHYSTNHHDGNQKSVVLTFWLICGHQFILPALTSSLISFPPMNFTQLAVEMTEVIVVSYSGLTSSSAKSNTQLPDTIRNGHPKMSLAASIPPQFTPKTSLTLPYSRHRHCLVSQSQPGCWAQDL